MTKLRELNRQVACSDALDALANHLTSAPPREQAEWVIWLLQILERHTTLDHFPLVLMNIRNTISARLRTKIWPAPVGPQPDLPAEPGGPT